LATEEFAKAHGLKPKIEMAGWSMTSDASHFVFAQTGDRAKMH